MRPTPSETAHAVGRLLDSWADLDELSSHLRWQVRRASAVLKQTDWDDASSKLDVSNVQLAATVERCLSWCTGLAAPVSEHFALAATAMATALAPSIEQTEGPDMMATRNRRNTALRGAVDTLCVALESDRDLGGHPVRRREGLALVMSSIDLL